MVVVVPTGFTGVPKKGKVCLCHHWEALCISHLKLCSLPSCCPGPQHRLFPSELSQNMVNKHESDSTYWWTPTKVNPNASLQHLCFGAVFLKCLNEVRTVLRILFFFFKSQSSLKSSWSIYNVLIKREKRKYHIRFHTCTVCPIQKSN